MVTPQYEILWSLNVGNLCLDHLLSASTFGAAVSMAKFMIRQDGTDLVRIIDKYNNHVVYDSKTSKRIPQS